MKILSNGIRRIYSLNLASWLRLRHTEKCILRDDEGKAYFVFEDAEEDVKAYRECELIQSFIREYKRVRNDVRKLD